MEHRVLPEWAEHAKLAEGRLLQDVLLVPVYPRDGLFVTGWRMLVGCKLLNQTGRRQVDRVWPALFSRFPVPWPMSDVDEHALREIVAPLGFKRVRSRQIRQMTYAWFHERGIGWSVKDLPGCGRYAQDSWDIFVNHDATVEPLDKELRRYLEETRA